ncbi:hypothetical protein [Paenibacillus sp. CF384]|uniref:hypothetical protein n=1 Tax=Paenibacillus sp. CF384 TaxID=1884382 RepID=UPI00089C1B85|nr:hypothetical protein [Paenibacillus sp. CF384]SDW20876.1 hypothetical protein SAMN05518855_1001661 [Paenibacillus sp. CF384]
MSQESTAASARSFTVSGEIFSMPNLDIYAQMTYIVLSSGASDSLSLSVPDMARKGRMTIKQVIKAMQDLTEQKLISHKVFRHLIGEFQDDRLSWSAKGLLTYCKEHPSTSVDELIALSDQSDENETTIRKALLELKHAGYLEDYPELRQIAT